MGKNYWTWYIQIASQSFHIKRCSTAGLMPRIVLLRDIQLKTFAGKAMMKPKVFSTDKQPLVMVVEDNEDNVIIVEYLLDSLGCRVIHEIDGTKVLPTVKQYRPNIIIMDIMLPGTNGIDIFHQLQQDPVTSAIPVVALTALAMIEDKECIQRAGFHGYVTKPYTLEELEQVVVYHLQQVEAFYQVT